MAQEITKVCIKPCTCANAYMDGKYGRGMRVHNPAPKSKGSEKIRCAACGTSK
jgi:hypothetical protein